MKEVKTQRDWHDIAFRLSGMVFKMIWRFIYSPKPRCLPRILTDASFNWGRMIVLTRVSRRIVKYSDNLIAKNSRTRLVFDQISSFKIRAFLKQMDPSCSRARVFWRSDAIFTSYWFVSTSDEYRKVVVRDHKEKYGSFEILVFK